MIPLLFAQAQGGATGGSGMSLLMFEVVAIIAIFYFILIRPQQKERKRVEQSLMEIKRGDEVVTAGGIIADVVHIQMAPAAEGAEAVARMDDRVTIRSGESKLVVERGRIARVSPKGA
jgi:preprotein translocase subunit YajC